MRSLAAALRQGCCSLQAARCFSAAAAGAGESLHLRECRELGFDVVEVSTGAARGRAAPDALARASTAAHCQSCAALRCASPPKPSSPPAPASPGFISLPTGDLARLVRDVRCAGLHPKPEVGIQWGAGGDTPAAGLAAEGTVDASWAIRRARACLEAGATMVMVESEGARGAQRGAEGAAR